jgi:hypothetical protein
MAEIKEDIMNKTREEREKQNAPKQSSAWVPFFKSVVTSFLTVLVLAIVGACFINVTTTPDAVLSTMLPTDFKQYFPPPKDKIFANLEDPGGRQRHVQRGGAYDEKTCTAKKEGKRIIDPFYKGFPYGMAREVIYDPMPPPSHGFFSFLRWQPSFEPQHKWYDWQLLQKFKNWLAYSTAKTYISSRGIFKDYIKFFGPPEEGATNIFSNQTFLILIMAPLNALFVSMLVPFLGFVLNLWYSFSASFAWSIVGIFLVYTFLIASITSIMHYFQFLKTFLLLPLSERWPEIQSIITCNIKTLIFVFGWLVCTGAFSFLDPMTSGVMAVVYVILMGKMIYDSIKNK